MTSTSRCLQCCEAGDASAYDSDSSDEEVLVPLTALLEDCDSPGESPPGAARHRLTGDPLEHDAGQQGCAWSADGAAAAAGEGAAHVAVRRAMVVRRKTLHHPTTATGLQAEHRWGRVCMVHRLGVPHCGLSLGSHVTSWSCVVVQRWVVCMRYVWARQLAALVAFV